MTALKKAGKHDFSLGPLNLTLAPTLTLTDLFGGETEEQHVSEHGKERLRLQYALPYPDVGGTNRSWPLGYKYNLV